jgi:hypothetical protein
VLLDLVLLGAMDYGGVCAQQPNPTIDEDPIKKQLWPDQETYQREEQRRFEILDAHWDLPVKVVDLDSK